MHFSSVSLPFLPKAATKHLRRQTRFSFGRTQETYKLSYISITFSGVKRKREVLAKIFDTFSRADQKVSKHLSRVFFYKSY